MELIIGLIGVILTIITSTVSLAYWLGRKFAQMDERFKYIDERFEQIDERFKRIDERFDQIDERFKRIDERFNYIDERFRHIDDRFNRIDERFKHIDERFEKLDERFDHLEEGIKALFMDFVHTVRAAHEFTVEMLSYEGILRREAADVIRSEVSRIYAMFMSRLATMRIVNPLTKEELERIKYFIDKKELTYEEALEFRELARRLCEEYARQFPDLNLWKIYWYAVFWVGASLRLQKERRERREKEEKK